MSAEPGYDYDFELTIRSDPRFAQSVPRDAVESILEKIPGVARHGKGFLLDASGRVMDMEVQFRRWNEQMGEPVDGGGKANCVYLRIPAHARGSDREHEYYVIAYSIADPLGWVIFDETDSGAIISRSRAEPEPPPRKKPWWKVW